MFSLSPFWVCSLDPSKGCKTYQGRTNFSSGKKKSTKINFLGPETARWGGGLPREGVGVENFVPSLESLSSLGFEERNLGCPGNFAGTSRTPGGVQKVCAKKVRAHFSFPKKSMVIIKNGNVQGEVRVNFLALFASKPHIFMCGALKLSGIVRANFRLNIAIAMLFGSLNIGLAKHSHRFRNARDLPRSSPILSFFTHLGLILHYLEQQEES